MFLVLLATNETNKPLTIQHVVSGSVEGVDLRAFQSGVAFNELVQRHSVEKEEVANLLGTGGDDVWLNQDLHKRHLPSGAPGHISAKPCALLHLSGVISCAAKSNINREPIKQQKQEKDVKKNKSYVIG